MSLILVGIHIDETVDTVERKMYEGINYFKSNKFKVFDTDGMIVYDLSYSDIVRYNLDINLLNRSNSDTKDFIEINKYGDSINGKPNCVFYKFPLVCTDGVAQGVKFFGCHTQLNCVTFYINVLDNSFYISSAKYNIIYPIGCNVDINESNSNTIILDLSLNIIKPINYFSYYTLNDSIYVNLDDCNEDIITIPSVKQLVIYLYKQFNLKIVIPISVERFILANKTLALYFMFSVHEVSRRVTFIVSKKAKKFLFNLLVELCKSHERPDILFKSGDIKQLADTIYKNFNIAIEFY
jgi:hypothetical protein